MSGPGTVVHFPSGRISDRPPVGPRCVATIAEALARDAHVPDDPSRNPSPVSLRLDALCGVDDRTVARLAAVAAAGSLTAESAARLALRHAEEIGRHADGRTTPSRLGRGARFDVSGDLFGDHAITIVRERGRQLVCAAAADRAERLLDAFPARGFDICLLVCTSSRPHPSVRILARPTWRRTLPGRMAGPGWRTVRHVVVVGGLPDNSRDRAAIVAGIREAVRRGRQRRSGGTARNAATALPGPVARILPLIELALPGLVSPR